MSATKEDTDFLEEFSKFYEEKFRVDEVINNIKSKISREVEETNIKISKERHEISKKEETINRIQKGIDLLVCERDSEKKRCEFFAANADLASALKYISLFGVQKTVFKYWMKINYP